MSLYHAPHRLLIDAQPGRGSPPSNARRMHGEEKFDTNMIIILAALLCALICALGINSIVRCILRCTRRFSRDAPDEMPPRFAGKGLRKTAIRQLPVVVYRVQEDEAVASDCPICLSAFMDGERVRVLPKCHHCFHVRCIDMWLASHSSCPTCRQSLLEQPSAAADAADARQMGNVAGGHGDVEEGG